MFRTFQDMVAKKDGLLAEGYVAKISMLILATYPEAALDVTIRNQNQN